MNKTICDECLCWPVCSIYRATNGVRHCKYFYAGSPHAKMVRAKEPVSAVLTMQCSACGAAMINLDNYCPNCGAKMDLEDKE